MTTTPSRGGSSVSARSVTPSLQLAKLAELIGKALNPDASSAQASLPLVRVEGAKVLLNTRGVLFRLFQQEEFKKSFAPGDDTGFVRDLALPPRGTTARVGGRLLQGTEGAAAKAIAKLHEAVSEGLSASLAGVDLASLTLPSVDHLLQTLAKTIGESKPNVPSTATLVPIAFASNDRSSDERSKDIGRVLTAIETVEGADHLDSLLDGIANKLRKDGMDLDEVDETLDAIRAQRNRPGSQIREFLDFLDDEALARVRLQVTLRLMDALADQSVKAGFQQYVRRVRSCYERFGGTNGAAVLLDASSVYGQANCTDLAEHLRKAMFYTCLPAWAQGSAQLFETRTEPTQGFATVREVSYRFRVNGDNPMTGKSAFESRLDRLQERLLKAPGTDLYAPRDIAEMVFLHLVIPDSLEAPSALDVDAEARSVAARIKADPVGTLTALHASLKQRARTLDAVAGELVELLKSKVNRVVSLANSSVDRFTVSLHRNIVNWEAVNAISPKTDILVKAERGDDSIAWFSHLTVSDAIVLGGVGSYAVRTELKERSLAVTGEAAVIPMKRDLSDPVLPIRYSPFRWLKLEQEWVPSTLTTTTLDAGVGVEVQYDLDMLQMRKLKDEAEKSRSEQLRSAALSAFALIVYIALWELQRRVRGVRPGLVMTMVRLQHTGRKLNREEDANDANTAVYAVSQAVEKALAREGNVKLQGLTTFADGNEGAMRWKRKGALSALLGGQALQFQMEGALEKVALVTYVTRPCDSHPMHADADGYLFLSRTYVADKTDKGTVLRVERMRSRLVESSKDFKNPQPILEEIARLRKDGFTHVMLLSHHFGNRHIGRAAERNAPHGTLEFLDEAVQRFPEMNLYTLRRDVFPATRLRKRQASESGFEVVNFKDHQEMYDSMSRDVLRSLMPVYTFATLAVVGDESERPQSGFCTYFFDVEQRISNVEVRETVRQNILGVGQFGEVRKSLISVLRAVHFMESEKPAVKSVLLPVLDPFDWANPTKTSATGEVEIMSRRGGRSVLLSLQAVLAHVTKVLHKEAE